MSKEINNQENFPFYSRWGESLDIGSWLPFSKKGMRV